MPDAALLLRACASLAAIALVLYGLRAALRTRIRPGPRLLRVLETVFLPGAASLHVVDVAGRYYAVGRAAGAVSVLCEIPAQSIETR